jgi:hypothetical protein
MPYAPSIAKKSWVCQNLFDKVCREWENSDEEVDQTVTFQEVEFQRQKYRLWSRNISATQDSRLPTSLEYRIREDPTAQRNINQVLDYLEEDLESSPFLPREVFG